MQSKTSFFNRTIFAKTAARFWPIWFIYAAVWMAVLPLVLVSTMRYDVNAVSIQSHITSAAAYGGIFIGAVAAICTAMAVWSFLYGSRSASGMACLPIRREGMFLSVTMAGIVPLILVNVLVFLVTLGAQALFGAVQLAATLQWLGAVTLILIFFYGFAVFCAQLTGNIVVLPMVYIVLNFTAVVVEAVTRSLAAKFVYGLTNSGSGALTFLSPLVKMLQKCGSSPETVYVAAEQYYKTVSYSFQGWATIGIYAAVGIVFIVFALLLYRRRHMESAGDVVAVNVLKPVFKYCLTLGCALCLGCLLDMLVFEYSHGSYYGDHQMTRLLVITLFMLAGAFIGYFAAEMLIGKSFRVWHGKWAGFGASALVVVALMLGMELDIFGLESYIPEPGKVESVVLDYSSGFTCFLEEENIGSTMDLHRDIIQNKDRYDREPDWATPHGSEYVGFRYHLKNGRTVVRSYYLDYITDDPSTYGSALELQQLINTSEAITQRKEPDFPIRPDTIISASVSTRISGRECARAGGYEDSQEFILSYYGGYTKVDIAAMTERQRMDEASRLAWECAYLIPDQFIYMNDGHPDAAEMDKKDIFGGHPDYGETLSTEQLDELIFNYTFNFGTDEIYELYSTCIVPDMSEGTLGRIWLIADESYRETVYSAEISIDCRMDRSNGDLPAEMVENAYAYEYFSTVPTVDSHRTNQWLAEHGVPLYTIAQEGGY